MAICTRPVAVAACDASDGTVPVSRRKAICDPSGTSNVERWSKEGLNHLADYAAWLDADSWATDGKESRCHSVLDHAIDVGAIDPRLARAYAQRLALQTRDAEVRAFVSEQVASRTSDPGWADLELWFNRYLGRAARRRRARRRPAGHDRRRDLRLRITVSPSLKVK